LILLIDNYDSFTYNLYQYLSELGGEVRVERNDKITLREIEELAPNKIVISPGPCTPLEAGVSNDVISQLGHRIPILGVCLGHQCIGYAFGARISRAGEIMHGKTSAIFHDGKGALEGLTNPLQAIRYHSLAIEKDSLPDALKITAWTEEGLIMGIRHTTYPIEGVQFHPESIMTPQGKDLLKNFLSAPSPKTNSTQGTNEGGL